MKPICDILGRSIARSLLLVWCGLLVAGCDGERKPAPAAYDERLAAKQVVWAPPAEVAALVDASVEERTLDLSEASRYSECWELFEADGKPREPFPFPDRVDRALATTSCELEGGLRLADGTRVYAWGTEERPGSRVRNLRVAAWAPDGALRWTTTMDRGKQAPNWIANFRRSFLIEMPRHICFGTLWEGETQAGCVDPATGEDRWRGSLPFWSGVEPQPGKDGFFVADLSALTKRYPYSGAEMRHLKLDGLGGRAGYYASDGHRLYYAGSREEKPSLVAYDFEKFRPVWQTTLPTNPSAALSHAFDAFDLTLLKIEDVLYAVDTESGSVRWAWNIGNDAPPIVAHGDTLYLLLRQPERDNLLFAIAPETGFVKWRAPTPAGTLRVESTDGVLVLGSVRAVQHVRGLDLPETKR